MKEIENPYLKELVDRLPCTVLQSEADSTVKCYCSGGKLFFGKTGKIRTSSRTNARSIIFTGLNNLLFIV